MSGPYPQLPRLSNLYREKFSEDTTQIDANFASFNRFCEYSVLENKIVILVVLHAIESYIELEDEMAFPQGGYLDIDEIAYRLLKLFARHVHGLITDSMYSNDDEVAWRSIDRALQLHPHFFAPRKGCEFRMDKDDLLRMNLFFRDLYHTDINPIEFYEAGLDSSYAFFEMRGMEKFKQLIEALGRSIGDGVFKRHDFICSRSLRDQYVMMILIDFLRRVNWFEVVDSFKPVVKSIH